MLKPPSQNVPGMTDTLEFVKNLWGGMGVPVGMPGLGAPQVSIEDLDKRITDLKAVETWLNLNLTMLRTSIQGLEVQRGTIAALKSMSDSMAQVMGKAGDQTASLPPFASFFTAGGTPQPGTGTAASASSPGAAQPGADGALDATMAPAVAWWNLLQDQFRQAVASTMPADGAAPAPAASNAPRNESRAAAGNEARAAAPGNESRAAPASAAGSTPRAPAGGDVGGTSGTSSPKPARPKSDKA
ncbi:PhaM family polyhydroxyalkanoate granule multifunctional regulatory protein [Massilia niabensis]|uniref:PhaM family polyhydroxyalkanoate granule multifunctional regulatory protein n=1 Tax=Massilia niabensis TaxID=544910 RepID=A0ABW0L3Y2_9BURK